MYVRFLNEFSATADIGQETSEKNVADWTRNSQDEYWNTAMSTRGPFTVSDTVWRWMWCGGKISGAVPTPLSFLIKL